MSLRKVGVLPQVQAIRHDYPRDQGLEVWRQYVPPKGWCLSTGLHGLTALNTIIDTFLQTVREPSQHLFSVLLSLYFTINLSTVCARLHSVSVCITFFSPNFGRQGFNIYFMLSLLHHLLCFRAYFATRLINMLVPLIKVNFAEQKFYEKLILENYQLRHIRGTVLQQYIPIRSSVSATEA